MRKIMMGVAGLAAVMTISVSQVSAQERTITGAAIGAGSGLLIAGPVGAVVGGVAGATIGGPRISGRRSARSCYVNRAGNRVCHRR